MKSLGFRSPTLAPSSPSPLPSISLAGSPLSSPGRSPPPPKNAAAATPEPDTSTCGHSAASSPPPPSWPPSAGPKTPTSSPSPSSRSASASTATRPADDTDPDGHPTTPSAWAAPTSPSSPTSTSTTAPSSPSGTSYPTGPTGYCRASSAYRSSGWRSIALHDQHPTSQAARQPTPRVAVSFPGRPYCTSLRHGRLGGRSRRRGRAVWPALPGRSGETVGTSTQ